MLPTFKKRFDFFNSEISELKQYKNIKLLVMYDCKELRISPKKKILAFNPNFYRQLTSVQRMYLLEYGRQYIKTRNDEKANFKALNFAVKSIADKDEINELIKKMNFVSKKYRLRKINDLIKFNIQTKWQKLKQLLKRN